MSDSDESEANVDSAPSSRASTTRTTSLLKRPRDESTSTHKRPLRYRIKHSDGQTEKRSDDEESQTTEGGLSQKDKTTTARSWPESLRRVVKGDGSLDDQMAECIISAAQTSDTEAREQICKDSIDMMTQSKEKKGLLDFYVQAVPKLKTANKTCATIKDEATTFCSKFSQFEELFPFFGKHCNLEWEAGWREMSAPIREVLQGYDTVQKVCDCLESLIKQRQASIEGLMQTAKDLGLKPGFSL